MCRVVDKPLRRSVRHSRQRSTTSPLVQRRAHVSEQGRAKGSRGEQVELKLAVLRHEGRELHHLLDAALAPGEVHAVKHRQLDPLGEVLTRVHRAGEGRVPG